MGTLTLFGILILTLLLGVPIFASLGFAGVASMFANGISLISTPQSVFNTLDSFTLLAIPFFILAGNLMQVGGISRRLIDLANSLIGWLRGGLGASSILTCMFFATMSGSSSATTAAIGTTMIPAMKDKGYPLPFSSAAVAVGGELGAIIPPSLVMIVYGLIANVSIGDMFIAGIVPGLLIGLSLIFTVLITAKVKDFDKTTPITLSSWARSVAITLRHSWLALLMPVIILGGIYSGIFTATEASVVAVVYAVIVETFIYKELTLAAFYKASLDSITMTTVILLIVGFAALFGELLTLNRIPHIVGGLISEVAHSKIVFLIIANIFLLICGMLMEAIALIVILAPLLAPIAMSFGIDPIHFGMIMIANMGIGMVTPPVGINLFIVAQIANLTVEDLIRPLLLFIGVLVFDLLLITYIPSLSMILLH